MRIAIIGTGNVGNVLARRFLETEHDVVVGSRSPDDVDLDTRAVLPDAAAAEADLIVLAVPGAAVEELVRGLGDLSGKILLDCTNAITSDFTPRPGPSNAEQIQEVAPEARVVKAFNTTGSANMADPAYPDGPLVMPLCGNDAGAKQTVASLAEAVGFQVMDCGPLILARNLEAMALLWINQAYKQGWGPNFGFAVRRRSA